MSLHESICREHAKHALMNNCIGIEPQRNGGQALPSAIEKSIANMVKFLREQSFPVFPDDVMRWAADEIQGMEYAAYFPDGVPTRGWYRNWLSRMEFLTGPLRPLEQTRAEWNNA